MSRKVEKVILSVFAGVCLALEKAEPTDEVILTILRSYMFEMAKLGATGDQVARAIEGCTAEMARDETNERARELAAQIRRVIVEEYSRRPR